LSGIRRFATGIAVEGLFLRAVCAPASDCDVVLSDGSKLRDFEVPIGIVSGELSGEQRLKHQFHAEALGGLWYFEKDKFVHGWFYVASEMHDAMWHQVSVGAYKDCLISLGVQAMEDSKWRTNPLSIVSVSLNFTRQTAVTIQAREEKPWWRRW
jgi:hypothetical protein